MQSWAYSLLQHSFQHLTMLFYQKESKSCTDSLKHITFNLLYINSYKYYATTERQPMIDKLANKRFFSLKTPTKTEEARKYYQLIRILCSRCVMCFNTIIFLRNQIEKKTSIST